MKSRLSGFIISIAYTVVASSVIAESVSLSGNWQFGLDPDCDHNSHQLITKSLVDTIQLPGVLTAQGFGDPVSMETQWTGDLRQSWYTDPYYRQYQTNENFKIPFWLQPDRHYVGRAWYQREINIPSDWTGRRIVLFLERPHWQTTVWLDGQLIGSNNRLATPHQYDLGSQISSGRHRLTIAVDNSMVVNVGPNSHSVSDHTQGNWNGIAGRIELRATPKVWIDDLRVFAQYDPRQVRAEITIGNLTRESVSATLDLSVNGRFNRQVRVSCPSGTSNQSVTIPMDNSLDGWDEFHPNLYPLKVSLNSNIGTDEKMVQFGLRDLKTIDTRFTLNDTPIFLRGTLECCIFPLTSHPPTEVSYWKKVINACKAHGLNHIRFHSWCPPEAAFIAADELGFYYQVECSSWANQGATIGDGKPLDQWLYDEADAIIRAYGNHPSFMLMAYGNEPAGKNHKQWLTDFVTHYQQKDSRRLYTSGAGWPVIEVSDYHSSPNPRIQRWGEGLKSIINGQPPRSDYDWSPFVQSHKDAPVISHEIGQWCVYPNLDERAKYTGLLKAKNFDVFADQLKRHGMIDQAHDFLIASGKLQTLCYKADIEAALRTPGFGGFQLLDLHDFPGQGTALVGVLDPFWDSKGYVTAEEYAGFAGPVVPLARLPKHIYIEGELLEAPVQLAQFGPDDLKNTTPLWTITDQKGTAIAKGKLATQNFSRGYLYDLGTITTILPINPSARKLTLMISADNQPWANHWDIWVYPRKVSTTPADNQILIASELNTETENHLRKGGKLLWLPESTRIKGDPERGKIALGFSSIFWNTVWTDFQPPHTLGILCDPTHPALAEFPTEFHSNWQWWEIIHGAAPFILTGQPVHPTVQVIDDWVTARKLALVFEVRVGNGKLLACSANLSDDLDSRPVARQLRASLLAYMSGNHFDPATSMSLEQLQDLCVEPTLLQKLNAQATASSEQTGYEATNAIDGDPATIWHTPWNPDAPMPHEVIVTLKSPIEIAGLTYLPRQDMANGRIARYEIVLSLDGQTWTNPVASGQWPDSPKLQTIRFNRKFRVQAFKLRALSSVNNRPYAGAAEIDILQD